MKRAAVLLLCLLPLAASAQQTQAERAVIERDRQSAEFSNPALRDLHSRRDQQHLPPRPDEQAVESRERDAQPPARADRPAPPPDYRPLPLPGGPGHAVDPIPVQGSGG
ncbi:MAG TPA: hypothetical protein VEQ87_21760 [Burkholderiales bacterium]|nr:hypothetical protein [Burkholderiales bacterium]